MAPSDLYLPNWHVKAISVPGPDTDLSLYVSFDNARFLFGCGEGTQRTFSQKRMSMRGLAGVFLGSGDAKSRAGLAGVLMTAADAGIPKLDIVGPPDTSHFIATFRSHVGRDPLTVHTHSFSRHTPKGKAVEVFSSPNITVRALALSPPSIAGPSTASEIEYDPYEPTSSTFRPWRLSPSDVQRWCDRAVGDMFHYGPQARASRRPPSPPPSPSRNPATIPLTNPYLNPDGTVHAARTDTRSPLPLPSREDVETEMVYFCQAPDVRGKFDVAKANALGVPKGPARGRLTKGESIEVDDPNAPGGKRVIRPDDCLVGGGPGAIMILVNCSERNLDSLLENTEFHAYQPSRQQGDDVNTKQTHLVVHRVPSTVWRDARYQEWMAAFGDKTHHLIADSVDSPDHTVFNSAAWNTLQLSLLDSAIFTPPYVSSELSANDSLPPNTSFLVPNLNCGMHPAGSPDVWPHHARDTPFTVTVSQGDEARDKLRTDMPEYAVACDVAKAAVLADPRSIDPPPSQSGDNIIVTTLGTGSALPSKYRNVSATYLDIPDVGGILLDAGEGTLGQFRRRFGKDGMKKIYQDLKMIFISHMHADHHLGLTSLLEDRFRNGISTPLHIVAPPFIGLHLQESSSWQYPASQEALENVTFISINRLGYRVETRGESFVHDEKWGSPDPSLAEGSGNTWEVQDVESAQRGTKRWPFAYIYGFATNATREHWRNVRRLQADLGLTSIWAPVVPHRGKAYGLALEHSSGWKIVYSGDTKPSDALVEAGQGATLLIHEATLEDDKPEVAAQKGHSTFSQAIDVGKRMKARHILLNHFSQRYPKLPKLPVPVSVPTSSDGNPLDVDAAQPVVSISFDFMSVRLGEMWKMAHYMDAMSLLFPEEDEGEGSVLGAVVDDVNPTLNGVEEVEGKKNKNKNKGKGKGKVLANGQVDGETMTEEIEGNGSSTGEQKQSKRAAKREAQRIAATAKRQDVKRPCSPSGPTSELKKARKEDSITQIEECVKQMEESIEKIEESVQGA